MNLIEGCIAVILTALTIIVVLTQQWWDADSMNNCVYLNDLLKLTYFSVAPQ